MAVHAGFVVTPEEEKVIRDSLKRSDEEIAKDVIAIREWLKKQAHLPQDLDEILLEKTLQRNKFSLEKTKSKLDNYFSIRNLIPEFYDDRHILNEKMQNYMKYVTCLPMPKLINKQCRLIISRMESPDSNTFDVHSHLKYVLSILDLQLYKDPSVSEIYVADCQNYSLGHVVKFNPVLMNKLVIVFMRAYSDRLRGIHFVNVAPYINSTLTLLKSMFNEKLSSKVHSHTNVETLHKFIPKEELPIEYGGNEKSISETFVEWRKYIESESDWLVKQAELRSNEKLRIGTPYDQDMFGSIHGSFRALNVD